MGRCHLLYINRFRLAVHVGFLGGFGYNSGYTDANNYPLIIGDFNGDAKTDVGRTG